MGLGGAPLRLAGFQSDKGSCARDCLMLETYANLQNGEDKAMAKYSIGMSTTSVQQYVKAKAWQSKMQGAVAVSTTLVDAKWYAWINKMVKPLLDVLRGLLECNLFHRISLQLILEEVALECLLQYEDLENWNQLNRKECELSFTKIKLSSKDEYY